MKRYFLGAYDYMSNDYLNSFDEILKYCGYNKRDSTKNDNNTESDEAEIDPTAGASTNECRNANLDLAFGFQDADPMLLTVVSEVISNALSQNIPTNVADSFGNWLQLVAQVLFMFIAQQQYQQSGPGRYYNPAYRNVTNPFCSNPTQSDGGEPVSRKVSKKKKKRNKKNDEDIKQLKLMISSMQAEIDSLKSEISYLRRNDKS